MSLTAATNGPVHPPADMWSWTAMLMMMMAGNNSLLVHQSSLVVLPAETSGEYRRNGRRSENFAYQYLKYLKGSLICRKSLRHGTSGFTSHPMEGVLRILIVLKNPSPQPGLNLRHATKLYKLVQKLLRWDTHTRTHEQIEAHLKEFK
jgi:hypothetical protein